MLAEAPEDSAASVRFSRTNLAAKIVASCRRDKALILMILCYAAVVAVALRLLDVHLPATYWLYRSGVFWLCLASWVVIFLLYRMIRVLWIRPSRPLQFFWHDLTADGSVPCRLVMALPAILLLPLFFSTFCIAKSLIPFVQPFSWDSGFAQMDRMLHGGSPWQRLQPFLGHTYVTWSLDLCYAKWFVVWMAVLYWQAFSLRRPGLRVQFLITFCLCFIILGTGAAMVFSSAGPCFYGRVTGGTEYTGLSEYLNRYSGPPLVSVPFQEELWSVHERQKIGKLFNISAMPSMHASISFLLVLFGWRVHRLLALAFGGLAVAVALACIHLGWHYAVDIYVAIIATWSIWWVVGRLTGPVRT